MQFDWQTIAVLITIGASLLGGGFSCASHMKTYNEEIRPRVKLLFEVYFGIDEKGHYIVDANPDAQGEERGLQDIVASKMDKFSEGEQEKLQKANAKMINLLGKAKSVDDSLQKFGASTGQVLDALKDVLKIAAETYVKAKT